MPIALVATDFDGTIFAEFEKPALSPRLMEWLHAFQKRGGRWMINTGRDLPSLLETLARAEVQTWPDYLVLVEREIYIKEHGVYTSWEEWNAACRQAHAELFKRVYPFIPELVAWVEAHFAATVYADAWSPFCVVAASTNDADAIEDRARELCRRIPGLDYVRNDVYARFAHVQFNKGTALTAVARRLGWGPDQIFAAGDHFNDLPMLRPDVAAHLAAPANAVPAVQEAVRRSGGYVSRASCSHGVIDALERLNDGLI
ncbi:MAG: HAD hydrolase family protein [Verrucomicrobiota bacterium]|nr:HAD hydrolase family protein [Limisphaera sp.]MDW8381772.1 HAD hydrolase family protein [Verrucomicrobiota bacterium]